MPPLAAELVSSSRNGTCCALDAATCGATAFTSLVWVCADNRPVMEELALTAYVCEVIMLILLRWSWANWDTQTPLDAAPVVSGPAILLLPTSAAQASQSGLYCG